MLSRYQRGFLMEKMNQRYPQDPYCWNNRKIRLNILKEKKEDKTKNRLNDSLYNNGFVVKI